MAASNTAPAWRRGFLRELARSGSVALAADRAEIDRSSAYQARKANPAFAASWDRALAAARGRLAGDGAQEERDRPPRLRGGEVVRASKAGRPCILRAGEGRWCADSEQAFLAALSATANVRAAARAAGFSTVTVYNRRRQWPAFARAWDEAKAEGYVRLEMLLLDAATSTLDPAAEEEAREDLYQGPEMSVEQAMKLFFHRAGQEGGKARRYGWRRQEPDIEEVRAEILRKVEAIERAREAQARR
jgi:hypothetical protein